AAGDVPRRDPCGVAVRAPCDRTGGNRHMSYLADVGALARKDLRLELRARDTLPAMLLFVVSTLVVFHFTLPQNASRLAAFGLLWVALVFTALLGLTRCFAAEREQDVMDGLVLAPSDRSAIWLGKAISMLAFLVAAEAVALPAFALFFDPGIDGRPLVGVALAALALPAMAAAVAMIAFFAPEDADQGLSQKIFYFHVPIALTSYACFGWGAWKALRHLWKRDPRADLESYVAIHQGVIFGALT